MPLPYMSRSPFTEMESMRILDLPFFVTSFCVCVVENKMAAEFNVEESGGIVETEAVESDGKTGTLSDVTKLILSFLLFLLFRRSWIYN